MASAPEEKDEGAEVLQLQQQNEDYNPFTEEGKTTCINWSPISRSIGEENYIGARFDRLYCAAND